MKSMSATLKLRWPRTAETVGSGASGARAAGPEKRPSGSGLEPTIYGFIVRHSLWKQVALLVFTALELVGLAPAAAVSRSWERSADRCSLELTDDLQAFEKAHVELARQNLSDLAPPRLAYLLLFSHPTPPERLALGRRGRSPK